MRRCNSKIYVKGRGVQLRARDECKMRSLKEVGGRRSSHVQDVIVTVILRHRPSLAPIPALVMRT